MDPDTPTFDPRRAALLVMDYQPGILGRLGSGTRLLEAASAALAFARSNGLTIAYVRVALDEDDRQRLSPRNKTFGRLAGQPGMGHDAPETQVHEALAPGPGDIVVRKTRVGAFSTTDLRRQLDQRGVTTLVLAGISTSGVVLSTVRDAADADYRLYVLADACADPDPEVHDLLLERVLVRQAHVVTVADLAQLLAPT